MTQDFFLKLFRNASHYEPRGHFTTYFYRVLANLCFDHLRKRKRRKKVQSVQLDPIEAEGTELEPLARPGDPDRRRIRAPEATTPSTPRSRRACPCTSARPSSCASSRACATARSPRSWTLSLNEVKVLLHRGRKLLARSLLRTPVGREYRRDEYGGGAR